MLRNLIRRLRQWWNADKCWNCRQKAKAMCDHLKTNEPHCKRCCLQIQRLMRGDTQRQAQPALGSYPAWFHGRGVGDYHP